MFCVLLLRRETFGKLLVAMEQNLYNILQFHIFIYSRLREYKAGLQVYAIPILYQVASLPTICHELP